MFKAKDRRFSDGLLSRADHVTKAHNPSDLPFSFLFAVLDPISYPTTVVLNVKEWSRDLSCTNLAPGTGMW